MRQTRIVVYIFSSLALLGLLILAFARQISAAGPGATATSEDGIWQKIDNSSIATASLHMPAATPYQAVRLNKDALERQLARAPMEFTGDLRNSPAVLSLPMPDGSFQRFLIEESPVMDAALVARYPEIKSYRGQGIEDATATVRFDWTPLGFHAVVLPAKGKAINIQPLNAKDLTTYVSYYHERAAFKCGVTEKSHPNPKQARANLPNAAIGPTLRTERLAVAADWEFCNTIGGNTLAGTIAAINAYLNTINAIYEKELSTHMNLVNAPNVIYASNNNVCGPGNNVACNAGNDPYDDSSQSTMLTQVPPDLRDKIGSANYDVGHVIGTGGAGVAGLGVVCDNSGAAPRKGAGASRIFGPPGNSSASGLWAHELGHQHGANHTFNGTGDSCGPARNGATAWEPGSGSTLMAYSVCAPDNLQSDDDNRLHNGSYNEMLTYLGASGGCATMTATGNSAPTVDAGTAKTIPKLTPFTLTATGTDPDASDIPNLRFIWEQFDAGGALYANPPYGDQPGDPNTTTRPLFRCFSPVADKSRTFPSLTYILNNANTPPATIDGFQTAENLPAVSRTMNFRCTVRDQRGGVNDSSVAITVAGGAGPFAVIAPNGGGTLGGAQTITWSVNGTNGAPVSTANVKISLSTDGGNTFPTVLAASAPNTGTAGVTFPNGIINSTARVKVEAVGNIYFDISDANFTLAPGDTCPAISDFSPKVGNVGNTVTITGINFTNGGNVTGVKFTNNVAATFMVVNNTTITATVPAGAVTGSITISKAGCPDLQTGSFSVCSNAPVELSVDNGNPFGTVSSAGSDAYYVNRLTPATYPATLSQVRIFFSSFHGPAVGAPITVVAGGNAGGTTNIDNTAFQTFATTVLAQDAFNNYTLPNPITIASGDFVVGFRIVHTGLLPAAHDNSAAQNRSYTSGNGVNFSPDPNGNLMVRAAQVFTGCGSGGPAVCTSFSENFDGVTAPALPAGWVATNAQGPAPLWVTSTTTPDTAPNDAFVDDPAVVSDKDLDTPGILITSASQVSFRHSFNLERDTSNFYDGSVLEVSSPNVNGGAFTDITNAAVGGNFISGGYVGTISTSFSNPLAGRMAWSGDSGGYITTVANLGPNVVGQTIKLRFRMGSDSSTGVTGWRIDSLAVTTTECPPTVQSAVSRKVHGGAGTFDINLPLVALGGAVGIEDRTGAAGQHQIVVTFANTVTVGGVAVTGGTGSATFTVSGAVVTINLTGVTNAQRLGVTLSNVSDGTNTGSVMVPMGVLSGDTSNNGSVTATDVSQTKLQSGQAVTATNFREDVNVNGAINATDVSAVKLKSGTALP